MSTHSPTFDLHDTVFTKTPKGRAEMVERTAGLKSRQRTVLIMLDGQRLARDIAILSADEIADAMRHLLALELIEPLSEPSIQSSTKSSTAPLLSVVEVAAPAAAAPPAPVPAPVPLAIVVQQAPTALVVEAAIAPATDCSKLADIKAMMTDSANTYLGLMASDLVRRVHKARDEFELMSVVGHWHMAMRESKYGRDVAESHLARIKTRFGGDAFGAAAAH